MYSSKKPLEENINKPFKQISLLIILIMILHYIKNFMDVFIGFSLGILLSDFFDRRYPEEYEK